ncbi:Coiled-coil domain-containing protein 73 [Holothuria leucospilota]|uniref:Coiled-coil domain-containing protein 73 n=1 Tax=Holothuria leucospilota TaxID=206669 RepID=A0A9Q1BJY3_HOLLE|nr:Coiled-coil domain-containing protein 73 [Holothuria leucospilota]
MANTTKSETVSFQSSQFSSCEDLRHLLTQLCEEVCFLRMTKKESEERVRHLVADQHKHERQLEEEILKNSALNEKHVQELADLDRSYQDEIQHLKREKNKLVWENESWERNVKSVKDEVRTLQLEKYNLERMIREQSHCLKTHVTASSSHLKQATEIETNFKEVKQLVERCNTQTTNLSKEVKEAVVLNKRLSFINSHHNCEKRALETKLEGKEKIISELEIKSKMSGAGVNDVKDADSKSLQQTQEFAIIREQLRQTKSNEEILQKQLDQSRERNKEIIAQYEEAQKLVEQFMTGNERHKNKVSDLETENKKIREDVESLHGAMKEKDKRETDLQQEIKKLKASISAQENDFRSEISGLKEETEYLLKTSGILREKNVALEKRHADVLAQMTKLQEDFDKRQTSTADVSTLTEEKCLEEGTASADNCKNNQLIVHENRPSFCVKNEAVLAIGEQVLCKPSQQTSVEDCIISANSSISTMNVTNMTNHPEEEFNKKIGAFEKIPPKSNDGNEEIYRKTTQHNVTKADSFSLFNIHSSDGKPKLQNLRDGLSSSKASIGSVLLVHTTENIASKYEKTKMDTCDASFENIPSERFATELVNSDNVTTSGTEISHTNNTGNTSEIAYVMEEQTCENNSTAPCALHQNEDEAVATGLSSANVIQEISSHINVAEMEGNNETSETNDNDISDRVGISKMASHPTDSNQDTGVIKKNDRQNILRSSTALDHTNVALMTHGEVVTTASEDVNSSQVGQTKVDKSTISLKEPIACDDKTSSFEGVKDQKQTAFEPAVKQNFRDPDIASDGGNVCCRANECSTSVVAKIPVSNYTTNNRKNTGEGCSFESTKLSQCCRASNLLVDTTTWESVTVSTSQMVTASEGTNCNNINQIVSFRRNANESLGCPAFPLDVQMNESRNRQPDSFVEESTPPKRRCVEYETSNADEINSMSIGPDDRNRDNPTLEKLLKPINITNQQLIENTPSLTVVTQITNARDDLLSTEILTSQENVKGAQKYEKLSQRIRIITPEKPSASFVCMDPEVPHDRLLTQYPGSSDETNTSTIKPTVTTPMKPQYTTEKSREVSPFGILSIARPVPQSQVLNSDSMSPGSGVVNLQNLEMEPNVERRPEVKEARDLCGMSRSAGSHPVQPASTFPVKSKEICAVSWSSYKGKGGLIPPTKVSLQSLTGSEVPPHGVNKEMLRHSKFKVKLHDVLKDFPGKAGPAFQFSQEKGRIVDDKGSNVVGESVDYQPLPLGHTFPASGYGEMGSAPGCDEECDIYADNPSVLPMGPDIEENWRSFQREDERDTLEKRNALSQDPQINLFSDVESEEDDISSTLTKEIERAQSILNRNRLKRTRRCKKMTDG